jgi:hypothetical protein
MKTCVGCTKLTNLVASCQQAVDNLSTSWKQAVRTYPVDKLLQQQFATSLLQVCYNLCVFTCVHYSTQDHQPRQTFPHE